MKLWMQYVKQRRRGILAGVLFVVIFLISFVLYRLPVKAVCYPAALCFFLGLLFTILDVRRVKRRHDLLTDMRELTDILTQAFPSRWRLRTDFASVIQESVLRRKICHAFLNMDTRDTMEGRIKRQAGSVCICVNGSVKDSVMGSKRSLRLTREHASSSIFPVNIWK